MWKKDVKHSGQQQTTCSRPSPDLALCHHGCTYLAHHAPWRCKRRIALGRAHTSQPRWSPSSFPWLHVSSAFRTASRTRISSGWSMEMRLLEAACGVNGDGALGDGEEGSAVWGACRERPWRRRGRGAALVGRTRSQGWGTDFSGMGNWFFWIQAVEFSIRPLLLTVIKK
jgi:hypothetical protein